MQHIIIITTSYPFANDGSEAAGSFVADFAKVLSQYLQVTVIAPSLNSNSKKPNPNLTIKYFKVPRLPLSLLKPHKDLPAILTTLNAGKKALKQVVLENNSIEHIFALWALPSGYWAETIGKNYNIPYSTWALGSDIWNLGKIPLVKNVLKKVLKNSHTNFADGYLLKQSVESISERTCHFLPSTRSLNIAKPKQLSVQPPYRLAFLGRWHFNKGIDLLLESLNQLSDWESIEEIRICGGGPLESTVKSAYTVLKKSYPITLQGYLNKTEAIKLLLWADYILIPSRIESIPVIFSDAMKCQCPVVSMPVGDLSRLITKYEVGILAKEVSATAFAQAINHILTKSPSSFSSKIELAANDFNIKYIVKQFIEQLQLVPSVVNSTNY
ncbi:MAG: glycosyltransferase [Candidatus Marithrix sp.]|nr:glycosyltransferase [Candidatus Marithrix sp.]